MFFIESGSQSGANAAVTGPQISEASTPSTPSRIVSHLLCRFLFQHKHQCPIQGWNRHKKKEFYEKQDKEMQSKVQINLPFFRKKRGEAVHLIFKKTCRQLPHDLKFCNNDTHYKLGPQHGAPRRLAKQ